MAKSKYRDDFPALAEKYALQGLNDEQIAYNLGIHPDTLYAYKNKYSEFSEAIKRGKEPRDLEVENALFKRATGYFQLGVKKKVLANGKIVEYEDAIYFPPDPSSMFFWLVNRMGDRWRSINRTVELTGNYDDRLKEIADTISKSDDNTKETV